MSNTFAHIRTTILLTIYQSCRDQGYDANDALNLARDICSVRDAVYADRIEVRWESDWEGEPWDDEGRMAWEDGEIVFMGCVVTDRTDGAIASLWDVAVSGEGITDSHRTDTQEALHCREVEADLCRELGVIQ